MYLIRLYATENIWLRVQIRTTGQEMVFIFGNKTMKEHMNGQKTDMEKGIRADGKTGNIVYAMDRIR